MYPDNSEANRVLRLVLTPPTFLRQREQALVLVIFDVETKLRNNTRASSKTFYIWWLMKKGIASPAKSRHSHKTVENQHNQSIIYE